MYLHKQRNSYKRVVLYATLLRMLQIAGGIILAIVILFVGYVVVMFIGQKISSSIEEHRWEKEKEEARWREIKQQENQLKEKGEL